MFNSQLQKSSLLSLLDETGTQQAEGRVRSKSLLEEMSLIGFVPYTDYYLHQLILSPVDLNDHLYVAPYLLCCFPNNWKKFYVLLTVNYLLVIYFVIVSETFEEAAAISPTLYAGYRLTTDNRPIRQTSMR